MLLDTDFADVTLVCGNNKSVKAHKAILSGSSSFFRNILLGNPHTHLLLYLKGVKMEDLQALLEFIYLGETKIVNSMVTSFLETAKELQVEGLTEVAADTNGTPNSKDIQEETIESENLHETVKLKHTQEVIKTDKLQDVETDNYEGPNSAHKLELAFVTNNASTDFENIQKETIDHGNLQETVELKHIQQVPKTQNRQDVEGYIYEDPNSSDKLEHTSAPNNDQVRNGPINVSCTYCSYLSQAENKKNQEWMIKIHMEMVHSRGTLIEELKTEVSAYDTNVETLADNINDSVNIHDQVYTGGLNNTENVQETVEIGDTQKCMDTYMLQERIDLDVSSMPDIIVTEKLIQTIGTENLQETITEENIQTTNNSKGLQERNIADDTQKTYDSVNVGCPYCSFVSQAQTKKSQKWIMKVHIEKNHAGENSIEDIKTEAIEVAKSIDDGSRGPYNEDACQLCGFKSNCKTESNRRTVLKTHVKTCTGTDKVRNVAPKERNISTLKTNVKDEKENTPMYSCYKCDFTTKRSKNLKRHILGVHDKIRRNCCSICKKKFSQKYDMMHHIRREHPRDFHSTI